MGQGRPGQQRNGERAVRGGPDSAGQDDAWHSPFAGRRQELATIDEALDRLGSDRIGFHLQLVGEPGIGKTRLLEETGKHAERRGLLVLSGRGSEFETDVPFRPFLDAFDDYAPALDPALVDRLARQYSPELGTAIPAFVGVASGRPAAFPAERYRTYRAVRALLEELALFKPLVFALDDMHWADPASIETLSHLAAHPPAAVGVVVALRWQQCAPYTARALAAYGRDNGPRRLELTPLSRAEADQIIHGRLTRSHADEIYLESGGIPFYLEQLLREWPSRETPSATDDPRHRTVPAPVAAALAAELSSLPPAARTLLQSAAVVGDPFEDDLAADVAGIDTADELPLLDQVVQRDLVRPTTVARRFRFRHPIVRRAVYESAGIGWRIGAHARAAAALRQRDAAAPVVAHHVEHSATVGDREAIATLIEAGHASFPRAPASAARWYEAALRLLPERDPGRMDLIVSRATASGAAGCLKQSHAALCEALDHYGAGQGRTPIELVTSCAAIERLMGRHREARARLLRALADLSDHRSPEAAALKIEMSAAACFANDFRGSRRWAAEAAGIARTLGDAPLQAIGNALVSYDDFSLGRTADALRAVTEVTALLDSLDDAALSQRLAAAFFVIWAEVALERHEDAIRHCERSLAVSRATGQGQYLVPLMHGHLTALVCRGRLAEASEMAVTAVDASRVAGQDQALSSALFLQCWTATAAGDLALSLKAGKEAARVAEALDQSVVKAGPAAFFAEALVQAGELQQARAGMLAMGGGPELRWLGRVCRTLAYEVLTYADIGLGDLDAAEDWASRAEVATDGFSMPLESARARRARAAVLLARGRGDLAADIALAAAEETTRLGALVDAGRCRMLAGRALGRAGMRERAVAELTLAERDLAACGASGYRRQAAAERRQLGSIPRKRASRGPGVSSLTKREREIAELVSHGRSNREIAAICYVSAKTVERHLSNIFAKLGVSSRAGVAGVVAADVRSEVSNQQEQT